MDRLGSIAALPALCAAAVLFATRPALAQDPALLTRVACGGGEAAACAPVVVPARERRTPPTNLTQLRDWQVGYFRRGGAARVVTAFDVSTDRLFWQFLAGWGTTTLGGPTPGQWTAEVHAINREPDVDAGVEVPAPAIATGPPRAKWVGALSAPWDSLLLRLELIAPEDPAAPVAIVRGGAVGRAQIDASPPPQPSQRLQISDVLLYEHDGGPVPVGLDGPHGAATRALGSTTLGGRQRVGLYWEVYGLDAGESARVELTIAPVVDSSTSVLDVSPVGVAWRAVASPNATPDAAWTLGFILDVARLRQGRHNILVTVIVPGQEPVTVVREIRVVVGG